MLTHRISREMREYMAWWLWVLAAGGYSVPGGWTAWRLTLACMRLDVKEDREKARKQGRVLTPEIIRHESGICTAIGVFLGVIWPVTLVLYFPGTAIMAMHERALAQIGRECLPPPAPPDLRATAHAKSIPGKVL